MKTLVFLHGLGGHSKENWFPWIKEEFKEYNVIIPDLPHADTPNREEWMNTIKEVLPDDVSNTYLIGHSLGGPAIIYLLDEWKGEPFAGALLIAAPVKDLGWSQLKKFFDKPFDDLDFDALQKKAGKWRLLYSDDDPYVMLSHGAYLKERLPAKMRLVRGEGHINAVKSESVKEEIEKLASLNKNPLPSHRAG
ncbi:alpha/beta fold hydrolase [Patescibacteria group bacterium]|nr:alpha/beta fold hydrolase [Patescibacteria group bacterium]